MQGRSFSRNPEFDRGLVAQWLQQFDQELDTGFLQVFERSLGEARVISGSCVWSVIGVGFCGGKDLAGGHAGRLGLAGDPRRPSRGSEG